MNSEQQRIAIAEACGWKFGDEDASIYSPRGSSWSRWKTAHDCGGLEDQLLLVLPYYLSDLNAMHEAEKTLNEDQQDTYWCHLRHSVCVGLDDMQHCFNTAHATASQRAEAFLKTLELWKA